MIQKTNKSTGGHLKAYVQCGADSNVFRKLLYPDPRICAQRGKDRSR